MSKEQERKYFKIIIRKLPEQGYTEGDFKENLNSLCKELHIEPKSIFFNHFIAGKSSKRRGPISSTGYITVGDESVAQKILSFFNASNPTFVSPSKINPIVDVDNPSPALQLYYKQPEVSIAPYSKGFKFKVLSNFACRFQFLNRYFTYRSVLTSYAIPTLGKMTTKTF